MIFEGEITNEEYQKAWYEDNVTEALDEPEEVFEKYGMSKRKYIITDAARHGYIEEMRNDDKLKLTEEEYQYARRCLFMSIWNGERAWVSDEKFKTMDISSMFEEDGLMDLYENREEIFGDRLWSDIVRYYEWEKYISKKITQK